MTLEARRKNQGKQYSVVSTADRTILYWHKPGYHLPVLLTHAGKDYLLTKDVVEEARVNQRSKLVVLTDVTQVYSEVTLVDSEINWKVVALVVVSSILALSCLATAVTALGA